METNPILEKLPKHLLSLVIDQPYNDYTARDQAVWRYVMRQNLSYLPHVCYGDYYQGLERTGITVDTIPYMYGMNRILQDIGWAAVAVDGFIPPAAFMEFQAYNVLVIAADIRSVDQIHYTPAPDIIHEAAGHAPIIADMEYAAYLKLFGEIGRKAFSSKNDYRLYEAIRHLSILKADPYITEKEIHKAEELLFSLEQNMGAPSEMAKIRNLHWWTVEYGLIGDIQNPKIYGAGLLSSIGESYSCLQAEVEKVPYSILAADKSFDITRCQPQLFVTPDFKTLTDVLLEFAQGMALKRGGVYALSQALGSGSVCSIELSSGLQISGVLESYLEKEEKEIFIKTIGATVLSYNNKLLQGHGKEHHSHGYSSPLGRIESCQHLSEDLNENEMKEIGLEIGKEGQLRFVSGIHLKGVLRKVLKHQGKNLLWSFSDCTLRKGEEILFLPEWGMFDLALADRVVSCWSGPADPEAYGLTYPVPHEKTHKVIHDETAKLLHSFYEEVRQMRTNGLYTARLEEVTRIVFDTYPEEWLLMLEIADLLIGGKEIKAAEKLRSAILLLATQKPLLNKLIHDGLKIVERK